MAIKPADAQKLWGRAGGRCSIGREPLSLVAVEGVLGEMAHIVARSPDGPRGDPAMPIALRDAYANLILLCPNHHTEVDHDPATWPIDRLTQKKIDHEAWIQEQIDRGAMQPLIRTSQPFRESRVDWWATRDSRKWLFAALTPLELSDGSIDPSDERVGSLLASLALPAYLVGESGDRPNRYHVEPSANGVAVEEFRNAEAGIGYRVEAFRTGHLEAAVLLDYLVEPGIESLSAAERLYRYSGATSHRLSPHQHLFDYHHFAEAMEFCTSSLLRMRRELVLPFRDMVFTLALFGEVGLGLVVSRARDRLLGRVMEDRRIVHDMVIGGEVGTEEALVVLAGRIVNAFGFTLSRFRDDNGRLVLPEKPKYTPNQS